MAATAAIYRANQVITRMSDSAVRQLNLTLARYLALAALDGAPDGIMSLGELSDSLQVRPATTTGIVDNLESDELVRRFRSQEDFRFVFAEILPAGRRVVRKAHQLVIDHTFVAMPWTPDELTTINTLMEKLTKTVDDVD
jgi:DNA-binding MarR family transcriptional regulator